MQNLIPRLLAVSLCLFTANLQAVDSHLEEILTIDDAVHLLNRVGIGTHAVEVAQLVGKSRAQAIEEVVAGLRNHSQEELPAWVDSAPPYMVRGSVNQKQRRVFNGARDEEFRDFKYWWLHEMLTTKSPQTERLVLFWHNHFVSAYPALGKQSTSIARQNRLLRTHAAGNFREFLHAIIRDAAMLEYLDNRSNNKRSPNENLARELMELFTLGEGNYTESDVRNAARALTGYTIAPAHNMAFRFEPWRHDGEEKEIFGQRGNFDGDDLIDLILERPQAAEFVSRKFWKAFINNWVVNEIAIKHLAVLFRDSNYDIAVLYRAILETADFWSVENRLTVVKSPVDLVIGTLRTLGSPVDDLGEIATQLDGQGQKMMAAPNVAGWQGADAWVTPERLLSRLDWLDELAGNITSTSRKTANRSLQANLQANGMNEMGSGQMFDGDMQMMQPEASGDMSAGGKKATSRRTHSKSRIVARLASDDFKGSPEVKLSLLNDAEIVWESARLKLKPGRDTLIRGFSDGTESYKWKNYRFEPENSTKRLRDEGSMAEVVLPSYDEVRVHFLNDAYNGDGDRNLYVDWVRVGEKKLFASDGIQTSACVPDNSYDAGLMYCGGHLAMTVNGAAHVARPPALHVNGLRAESVFLQWLNNPEFKAGSRGNRAEIVFSLIDTRLENQQWDNLMFKVRYERDQSISLLIDRYGCWPNCLDDWPRCAERSRHDPYARVIRLRFSADGKGGLAADQSNHCQFESLQFQAKSLVETLLLNIDKIHAATVTDGRLDRSSHHQFHQNWQPLLEMLSQEVNRLLPAKDSAETFTESRDSTSMLLSRSDPKLATTVGGMLSGAMASADNPLLDSTRKITDDSSPLPWQRGPFLPAGIGPEVRYAAVQQIFDSQPSLANRSFGLFLGNGLYLQSGVTREADSTEKVQISEAALTGFLLAPEFQLK